MTPEASQPVTPLYSIRDWDDNFETAQSRKYKKLSWVPIPNRHDSKGYRRLIQMKNGPALYGAALVLVPRIRD